MTARLTALTLAGVLLVGLIVRADHLDDRSLWFDEAFSWTLVSRYSPAEILARTARDVHPPLYYLVLWGWTRCCGFSPVALRAPSVLFGVATIGLGYLVARDAVARTGAQASPAARGRAAGVACAALIATSAAHVRWSWEARMYTQATMLLLLSLWCALRALDARPRSARYWWCGFACSGAALLYTHNYGLFSFVGICVWLILELSREGETWKWPWKARSFVPAAVSVVAVVWAYLPWLPVLQAQKAQVQEDYWIPSINWLTLPRAWYALLIPANGERQFDETAVTLLGVAFVAVAGFLAVRLQRIDRLALSLWLTPVLIASVISLISIPVIVDRHFLLSHLCVLIGIGGIIAEPAPSMRYWGIVGLLTIDGLLVLGSYRSELDVAERPGIRGAMAYILQHRREEEPVLVLHPCIYFSARYYVDGRAPVQMYVPPDRLTHYTGGPVVRDDDFFPLEGIDQIAGKRVWVLDTDGFAPGNPGMLIPAGWSPRVSESFREVYQFQGSINVTAYERHDSGNRNPAPASSNRSPSETGG